jgi:serine/threonine-protein kinase
MSENEPNEPTQMIEGRYRIVRNIAEGGMATVFEAIDERLGRTVAIKVMHTQLAQGPHRDQFVERFRREANSAAAIANPHIVQVYDTGEFNGLDFLVMEYVHGVNLRHEMNTQGTFSVRETLRVIAETLDGLASAHRAGVVHRDIKPENILINDRGHVQITDFGLAKAASQATLSSTGMLLGTAAYLAPEMIENNQATAQGDLYSVGITAWEMLAGKVPFDSDNPVTLVFKHVHEDVPSVSTVCPGIDPSVADFITHLTARSVEARPADGTAAADELRRIAAKLPMDAWQYRLHPDHADPGNGNTGHTDATAPALVGAIGALAGATKANANTGAGAGATSVKAGSAPANSTNTPGGASGTPDNAQPNAAPPSPPAPPIAQTTVFAPNSTQVMAQPGSETQVLAQDAMLSQDQASAQGPDEFDKAIGLGDGSEPDGNGTGAKKHRSRKPLIITLVVLVVLALTGGTGAWWWLAAGPGSYWSVPKPDDVTCEADARCSLAGAKWASYENLLKQTGIPYAQKQDYSDDIAKGIIISASVHDTDAFVDSHVSKKGQRLTVTVSKGAQMSTIPTDILDVSSPNGKDPLTALEKAGFDNVRHDTSKDEYSLDKPENALLTISPDPGTTLKHNAEVTVTLSKGPMPVSMPDIVGKTKDEMQASFDELKLTANITEQFDDKISAGEVISSSQKAGTQLKWGDSVDVVVSKGPETTVIPNVVGQKYDAAAKQLEALGFTVKKNAPLGDLTHEVRVQNPKAGETARLRDENGTTTVITLTVV